MGKVSILMTFIENLFFHVSGLHPGIAMPNKYKKTINIEEVMVPYA